MASTSADKTNVQAPQKSTKKTGNKNAAKPKTPPETVKVAVGLVDKTTFRTYDVAKEAIVHDAAHHLSEKLVDTVYKLYACEKAPQDLEVDSWVFPSGIDYGNPVRNLKPLPNGLPEDARMMVLLKLKDDDTPMWSRVLKEISKRQSNAQDYSALLADVQEMKMNMVTRDEHQEVKTQLRNAEERLQVIEEGLQI